MKKLFILVSGVLFVLLILLLHYSSVNNSLTVDDKVFLTKYLDQIELPPNNPTFHDEIKFISSVQQSVLTIAPAHKGIPLGQQRELKELYLFQSGLCFDRSRAIEKILRHSGFKTRHVSIYSTTETGSALTTLLTPGIKAHTVSEVLTTKGWLLIDPDEPFISIDDKYSPISIEQMKMAASNNSVIKWHNTPNRTIYLNPFIYIYGLYSRHGQFYPPYNFVPDINYGEFLYNFL